MSRPPALLALAAVLSLSVSAQQQFPTLEKGFQAEKLYQFGDVDSVNVFSGTLLINLPIGPDYRLDGGVSYGLHLSFNSKAWDLLQAGDFVHAVPSRRASAGFGWVIGMGRFVPFDDPANLSSIDVYEAPDGGDHRFDGVSTDACTSSCPAYTSDGSNLRLRVISSTVREIDFPDGVTKRFIKNAAGAYELREIRNTKSSDVVTITPTLGAHAVCPSGTNSFWTISDSRGRNHTVCFSNLLVDSVFRPMVNRVVFNAPGGGTATYNFAYVPLTISKPGEDTDHNSSSWRQTHDVQLLDTVTLPDGSTYRFATGGGGVIGTMTLPTLGKITYQYGGWLVPSTEICSNTYGVGFGFGGFGHGVELRTFTPAVPAGQTPVSRTWLYTRELRPEAAYISGTICLVNDGPGNEPIQTPVELYDELVVTITDPLGHKTASHFSVWPGGGQAPDPDTSPAGFKRIHHGYPYGRYDAAQDRYLSQEIFDCSGACALKRSVWVRQEPQPRFSDLTGAFPPVPNRMVSQRTVFHDDPEGCVGEGAEVTCGRTSTDFADWDGYGHYRQASATVRFEDDDEVRTVTTAWNKVGGVARTITKNDPWLLNTYESVSTTEGGVTAVEQTCFDLANGFLRGRRTLAGTSPASTDLLVLYENDTLNGNTSAEKFYGGNLSPLSANQSVLCSALNALAGTSPEYQINHEWSNGNLATSQYAGMPFFSLDLTVDLNGLVTSSRFPNGLETTYAYDANWRLISLTPPGQVATTYVYTKASGTGTTLTQPAKVVETTQSATAGTVKREYQFDAFGRLWRQKQLMPDGQWSLSETLYDKLGRRASISEAASLQGVSNELTFTPLHKTSFVYDFTGRPTQVTRPDSTSSFVTYQGARSTMRTYTVAGGSSETTVGRREESDALGRLVAVTENVDLNPGDGIQGESTTSYGYDIGGRLASVSMPGPTGTQIRTFTYDKRGLLLQEKHPEIGVNGNGTTTYSLYDARGHAGKKVMGSAVDLRYDYDPAERVIQIKDGNQTSRPLMLYSWDCIRFDVIAPCAAATHPGQLAASARFNYDAELGTIAVTEANQYDPISGQLVRRDFAVGNGEVNSVIRFTGESFFFTQSHNDLGALDALTYPCRFTATGCPASDPGRAIQHGYSNGALRSVGIWASNITYRPNGMVDTVTHGSGSNASLEKWEADPDGMARPRRIFATNVSGTQELWTSGNYEYDGSGNIKKIGNTSYAYDSFGRLTSWATTNGNRTLTLRRVLDAYGNELTSTSQSCGPVGAFLQCTGGASAPQRGIVATTNHYADSAYDTAGNVTNERGFRTYTWDPLGMMTSATVDGRTFRYIYDASNERIVAIERVPVSAELRNRTTFTLRGSGNQLLSIWSDNWTSGSRVFTRKEDTIWRGSQLLATAQGPNTMNYALDHLGSPRLITNATGSVLDVQNFDPFGGGGLFGSGALQFAGHERDQANIGGGTFNLPDYTHARYYDRAGRFLSVDPGRDWDLRRPQSWNMYAYVMNNPVNRTDPTGRCGEDASFVGPRMPCASRGAQGALVHAGATTVNDAAVRQQYTSTVARLSSTDSAGRTQAKIAARAATSDTGQAIAESMRPIAAEAARVGGSASKSNAAINEGMVVAGRLGKVAIVAGVTVSVVRIATAPEGQTGRVVAQEGGSWAGALSFGAAGAKIGGAIGTFIEPGLGTIIGGVVGGIGGGIGGAIMGEKAADNAYHATVDEDP